MTRLVGAYRLVVATLEPRPELRDGVLSVGDLAAIGRRGASIDLSWQSRRRESARAESQDVGSKLEPRKSDRSRWCGARQRLRALLLPAGEEHNHPRAMFHGETSAARCLSMYSCEAPSSFARS